MSEDASFTAAILVGLYLLGVAARIAWPFALAAIREGVTFDWRMVVGQILAGAAGFVLIVGNADFIAQLGAAGWFGAFAAGFGAGSIGREAQKTVKK